MDAKRKKIIYIITKSNWGGAQKYVYDLATSANMENDVLILHGGKGLLAEKLDEVKIKRSQIKKLDRDISIFSEIKVLKTLINIFYKEKPDIIHLNSSKIGGLGAFAGRITGVKNIIFTAHGLPFNEDRPDWQKILIKVLTYLTIFLSHKTIIISKTELQQIKNWKFLSNKLKIIHNGINEINFLNRKEARKILSKKIKTKNKENIIWVGTISELTKNKGLKYAVKSIKKLKKLLGEKWDGIFVIIGSGEDRGYLENIIKEKKLEDNVYLTGFLEDAPKYLKAFDIFLLSSVKEGLPYVLLEAGLAKNAIISTKVGGVKEIIDDMKNGILIRPKSKKEIANALSFYIKNDDKQKEFGNKIREKILKEFSTKKMIEKTFNLYE